MKRLPNKIYGAYFLYSDDIQFDVQPVEPEAPNFLFIKFEISFIGYQDTINIFTDPDKITADMVSKTPDEEKEIGFAYNSIIREKYKKWWRRHVIQDIELDYLNDELVNQPYFIKNCDISTIGGTAHIYLMINSRVTYLKDLAIIDESEDNTIVDMAGFSFIVNMTGGLVSRMCDGSRICNLTDNGSIGKMAGDSSIRNAMGHSNISEMFDQAICYSLSGYATIDRCDAIVGEMSGRSFISDIPHTATIYRMDDSATIGNIQSYSEVRIIEMSKYSCIKSVAHKTKLFIGSMWAGSLIQVAAKDAKITIVKRNDSIRRIGIRKPGKAVERC